MSPTPFSSKFLLWSVLDRQKPPADKDKYLKSQGGFLLLPLGFMGSEGLIKISMFDIIGLCKFLSEKQKVKHLNK